MSTSNFHLRNIPSHVMMLLRKKAREKKMSINSLLLQIIEKRLSFSHPSKKVIFHDLDHLAGTWNVSDEKAFNDNVQSFNSIPNHT